MVNSRSMRLRFSDIVLGYMHTYIYIHTLNTIASTTPQLISMRSVYTYRVTAQKFEYNCEFMKFHALIK